MGKYRKFLYDNELAGLYYHLDDVVILSKKHYKMNKSDDPIFTEDTYNEGLEWGIQLRNIEVKHNPNHPKDKNAVEIRSDGILIGYIPKIFNKEYLRELGEKDEGTELVYECMFKHDKSEGEEERLILSVYYDYD